MVRERRYPPPCVEFKFPTSAYPSFSSMPSPTELAGLHVKVDRVVHTPQLEAPPDRPHPFVYFITVINESSVPVTIKGRKWVVTDTEGRCVVVEGDGVVGEFPYLKPHHQFSYNSYHTIGSNSVAEG